MRITNKYKLPQSLVQAVSWDLNPRTGYSVTDLIQPPRITQLTRRHWDENEIDVSEMIWALVGQGIHYILAKGGAKDSLREEYLEVEFEGTKIKGRPDYWYDKTLDDYKITSAWSIVFEPNGRPEWTAQLNIYKWMLAQKGVPSNQLEVCAILRDWQASKAADYDYPKLPVHTIKIPVWDDTYTENYLRERIMLHLEAEKLSDDELPFCTDEETWAKPTTYAVMKEGRKTAIRVCSTREEAEKVEGSSLYIVERKGSRRRCAGYCNAKPFCNQNGKQS